MVRWLIFLVVCVVAVILSAIGAESYRGFVDLQSSVVYRDAISKVQNSTEVARALGSPIRPSLIPWGFLRSKDYFGFAVFVTRITGPRGTALVQAALERDRGVWRYSLFQVRPTGWLPLINLVQAPPVDPAELHGGSRVYLTSFGPLSNISLQKLADHFSAQYKIPVTILPPLPLDESVIDVHRDQGVAEEMLSVMKQAIPQLASDPDAFAIAVTDRDMYARDWSYAFNYYKGRTAVISTSRLDAQKSRWPGMADLLEPRVRKLIARDLGLLYYKLPYSNDPTSLLYRDLSYVTSVDTMQESYLGAGSSAIVTVYPATHSSPPLHPVIRKQVAKTAPGAGDYPCLLLEPVSPGTAHLHAKQTTCRQTLSDPSPVERYEVALASGWFVLRQTDLFLPDSMPLALTRTYSSWDTRSNSFGIGGNHPYDIAPFGRRNPYSYMSLALSDGSTVEYPRVSEGTGYRDALYEYTATSGLFYGSQIRWNGNGWDLKFEDGSLDRFPESYWSINQQQDAQIGMRSPGGEEITFERDPSRRLIRLTSPHGQHIAFSYDGFDRIARISDGAGHDVDYVYDQGGRLVRVLRSGAIERKYSYEYNYLLSVEDGSGHKLLINQYDDNGRIEKQTLGDGSTWQFRYTLDKENNVTAALLIDPAGRTTDIPVRHPTKKDDSDQD